MIFNAFGTTIRKLREKKEITQEGLADLSGLNRTYIGAVERGERNISLKNIQKLSNALDISLSELFTLVDNKLRGSND